MLAGGAGLGLAALGGRAAAGQKTAAPLVTFAAPWTSPFRVDHACPHQLVNSEGEHLFILNKTAWAYFGCKDPVGVLERARAQGVNVIRVALEGRPYWEQLGIELWPWGGTRERPEWSRFNEPYWVEVERRTRLAGDRGIGLDVVLTMALHPEAAEVPTQRPYWEETLRRLGRYANVLTWEIANEFTANEAFQDQAGAFFKAHDPQGRPVCTSDGTTDDAVWPQKPWMDMAINHSCTSSTPRHPLREWYLAVARSTRAHGKPAWCNESGREKRHGNDDPVHRRKQGWLWCAAGNFWTHHSWEGCEGIDDAAYRGPGQEFLRPMAAFFRALPFWRLDPNFTVVTPGDPRLVDATLADANRSLALTYLCTPESGASAGPTTARLRLPKGEYEVACLEPATTKGVTTRQVNCEGAHAPAEVTLPPFTDDLLLRVRLLKPGERRPVPGTG